MNGIRRPAGIEFALVLGLLAGLTLPLGPARAAQPTDRVFTIGNYPVEATAKNAVEAKRAAIADGRTAAFRSLLKRLIPVTAYGRIKSLDGLDPGRFVAGVAVRSERNSATRYIASLDFAFSPRALRDELRRRSVPFVDKQAPQTVLVAIYNAPKAGSKGVTRDMSAAAGGPLWAAVWSDLDLTNTVTPLRVTTRAKHLHPDTIRQISAGDLSAARILASEYGSQQVVLAIASPDPAARRLHVVIAGQDGVGVFSLNRKYRIEPDDFAYSLELAAVISLGILEGRWKAVHWSGNGGSAALSGAPAAPVQLWVEFQNLGQWRSRRQVLSELPGVQNFQTGGLSARGASVALRYPGGGEALRATLARQGLTLEAYNGTWIMR